MMVFKDILHQWTEDKELSRKELIALLQLKDYSNFQGVDAITLSRWFNGKSVPPIERQLRIALCLEVDLVKFILSVENKGVSHKVAFALKELERIIDQSMNALSYLKLSSVRCEVHSIQYDDYVRMLGDFYHNISAINALRKLIVKNKDSMNYEVFLLKNSDGGVVGHWLALRKIDLLKELDVFSGLDEKEIEEGILLKLAYFNNTRQMFELIVVAISYYLTTMNKPNKRYAYVHLMSYPILEFTKQIYGAEELKFYPPRGDDNNGVYLVRIDIIKAIASPVIFPLVKERLTCLSTCYKDACNKCNLIEHVISQYS